MLTLTACGEDSSSGRDSDGDGGQAAGQSTGGGGGSGGTGASGGSAGSGGTGGTGGTGGGTGGGCTDCAPEIFAANHQARELAVDSTHVYFTGSAPAADDKLWRLPKSGGAAEQRADAPSDARQLLLGNSHAVFRRNSPGSGQIYSVAKSGGGATEIVSQTKEVHLDVDGDHVIWQGEDGLVHVHSLSTAAESTVGPMFGDLCAIGHDGTYYFVATCLPRAIHRMTKAGADVTQLASGSQTIWHVATEGGGVFWEEYGSINDLDCTSNNGGVYRVPIGGGQQATLGTGQSRVSGLSLSSTHAFWLACRGWTSYPEMVVHQSGLDGASPTVRDEAGERVIAIAADDTHLYYSVVPDIWRMGY